MTQRRCGEARVSRRGEHEHGALARLRNYAAVDALRGA